MEKITITSEDLLAFRSVLKEWEIKPDYFENLHDVCDPNQALIDAFGWADSWGDEDEMAKTVDFGNAFCVAWDAEIKAQSEFKTRKQNKTVEHIIRRKNGDQVKIEIRFRERRFLEYEWEIFVSFREAGKRSWMMADNVTNDYKFRALPTEGDVRERYVQAMQFEHVTTAEIEEAKMKAWQTLKP